MKSLKLSILTQVNITGSLAFNTSFVGKKTEPTFTEKPGHHHMHPQPNPHGASCLHLLTKTAAPKRRIHCLRADAATFFTFYIN